MTATLKKVRELYAFFLEQQQQQSTEFSDNDVSQLPKETLDVIEADSFWCMSKLLDGIQVCNAT